MDPQAAIDAPRTFSFGGKLRIERSMSAKDRATLEAMGHVLHPHDLPIGGAQAIRIRPDGVLEGGSDPRKDGIALGY
jgi:gamma-glutamyltranspeptidase/glutathione hydrolase